MFIIHAKDRKILKNWFNQNKVLRVLKPHVKSVLWWKLKIDLEQVSNILELTKFDIEFDKPGSY